MTTTLEDLSAGLASLKVETNQRPCPYQRMVDKISELDPDVGELLATVVHDRTIPMRRIHIQVQDYGYSIGAPSISLHRAGVCTCPKENS